MHFRTVIVVPLLIGLLAACETAHRPDDGQNGRGTGGDLAKNFVDVAGDRVFFDYDAYDLRPEARTTLTKQAAWLKAHPNYRITIEGHADERGTREYNLSLGARRAETVKSFLVAQGLPADRLNTVSYGKERPEVPSSDEAAWSRNRRGITALVY